MQHCWDKYFDTKSEYWEKAQKIYKENDNYPKIVVPGRNLHHKFPRSFSKKDGFDIDNDDDNLVSLSLSDHFLVHYYIWKCSLKGYRRLMAVAFRFMRKKAITYASDDTIEALAKDYAEMMKDVADVYKSAEYRKKLSDAQKGKRRSKETKNKISEARKGISFSEETKRKISKNVSKEMKDLKQKEKHMKGLNAWHKEVKGAKWWNNGVTNKMSKECPGDGWVPGVLQSKRGSGSSHKGKHWKLVEGKRIYY